MKKTTSIFKVFAVSVLLLISTALFSQQQVIENLKVVDSLVISSLERNPIPPAVGGDVTSPYRHLIIDAYGRVRAGGEYIPKPNCYLSSDSLGIVPSEIPSWSSKPYVLYVECPVEAKVGIGTQNPVNKLDVIGSGYFSDNVGIGLNNPQSKLDVNGLIRGKALFTSGYAIQALNTIGNSVVSIGNHSLNNGIIQIFQSNGSTESVRLSAQPGAEMWFNNGGNVGIGCTSPQYKLQVNGTVKATEVRVTATGCDFVFEDTYKLPSIAERKAFIKKYKHLPNINPAKDMQENGMDISATTEGLLQNMEEISLYQITHDEKIELLLKKQEKLEIENQKLKEEIRIIKATLINNSNK